MDAPWDTGSRASTNVDINSDIHTNALDAPEADDEDEDEAVDRAAAVNVM